MYVDCQLPFGLASAPAIFNAIADALEWILRSRGIRAIIHYLDDFLVLGAPASDECQRALELTICTCDELGVPLAMDKVEGPCNILTFLGIELNSTAMSVALPADKLLKLQHMLQAAQGAKCIKDYESFESLIGHLVHATKVLPLGKAFLNQLFAVFRALKPHQVRRLNSAAREDLAWWDLTCHAWVGSSVHQFIILDQPRIHLFSDASRSWGCGAYSNPLWFQIPWSRISTLSGASISLKELLPIIVAAAVWGPQWSGSFFLCHSDNTAAVAQVNKLHAADSLAAHLLRCLAYFQALFDFRMHATHIPGKDNTAADDLSRDRAHQFLANCASALPSPTQVPPELLVLLVRQAPDWTSRHWRGRLQAISSKAWQPQPKESTSRE